ncbi:dihydrolipoyl dehydrogenase [Halobacteriales archaeon QH_8_64_26]|nr:MAG: dihydrolipoyl dehydrogenase [Halobacteriales archaeon QH_8_64_26]
MVVGDVTTGTDVLIIGAGPGGYVAAIRAGQLDLDVTLVEREAFGGACLNHGCIPSKALISATDVAHDASGAEHMGISADPDVDFGGMVDWKNEIVESLTGGVEKLCKANGVNLIEGRAEFAGENTVRVAHAGEGQGSESIEFEQAVIATGSRPMELPGLEFDGERIIDSRRALALESTPSKLVVVGAGYIGMELSSVFAKLEHGVDFHFGEAAQGWEESGDGLTLHTENEAGEISEFGAEKVLVAIGREPVIDTLGLDALGLEPNENGFLTTDEYARTDLEHVFAVGDVAGEPMLAHKGMQEGEVAAEVIAGEPAALDYQAIPAAVFTDPEIGTVGLTEAEAKEEGFEPVVGQMPMQASGRALTLDETDGFVRIVADDPSGFVLGAQAVAPEASEIIAELALAVEMGATLEDVGATIHTHPTLGEAAMEAAENAREKAIHTLNR